MCPTRNVMVCVSCYLMCDVTWKLFNLGDAREDDVDPSVVCPEVDTEPFSVNFE